MFNINIHGVNKYNVNCRIWLNVLDRKDGSFIVRYKLYETCYNLKIEITHKHKHVGNSPFVISGDVYADECNCPQENISEWLDKYQCKTTYTQIDEDLKQFPVVNFTEIKPTILSLYNKPTSHSICNYVVLNNEVTCTDDSRL